jgi:hypothetical protein
MRKYDNFEYEHPLISSPVSNDLKVIVVIPAFNEHFIEKTIDSLKQNSFENGAVEIIIVINESDSVPENISEFHKKQYDKLKALSDNISTPKLKFFPVYIKNIDKNIAGPGIARKIGMDEAVKRFDKINYQQGLIVNLDGDTIVEANYLDELIKISLTDTKIKAYSIYFEHNLNGNIAPEEKKAIIQYELHLRYYINMQRLLKLPFAYYTIGSAMAVRNYAYKEAFGMNKRQAGEDFYFLHKFIKTGYFAEINSTKVFPSARISDRVPFGTGRAISNIIRLGQSLQTYNFRSFESLNSLLSKLEDIYHDYNNIRHVDKPVLDFLKSRNFIKRYLEIKKHTKDYPAFKKRFFRWFDAFLLMKYLHFARDSYYKNIDIEEATVYLLKKLKIIEPTNLEEALFHLRNIDRNNHMILR